MSYCPSLHYVKRQNTKSTTGKQVFILTTYANLFSNQSDKPTVLMKRGFASIGDSVSPMTLCSQTCASTEVQPRGPKIRLINVVFLRTLSEIKLKRTDTTLDLSQKAKRAEEKKRKRRSEVRSTAAKKYIPKQRRCALRPDQ